MKYILLSILALGLGFSAYAQEESSNKTSVSAEKLEKEKPKKEDIDNEITNARMRASTGSKSKLSIRTALGFDGGTVESPFQKERPPLLGDAEDREDTSFGGSVALKYRVTERTNLAAGAGVSLLTPFHTKAKDVDTNGDIDNPYLEYGIVYKLGPLQMVTDVTYTHYTQEQQVNSNLDYRLELSHNMLASFENGLTVGVALSNGYVFFDDVAANERKYAEKVFEETGRVVDLRDSHNNYTLNAYPYAEYSFNDTFSLRTVFGIANYRHERAESDRYTFVKTPNYQSIGLGISVTRDVYLYPNVQFLPSNLKTEKTNVGLSANLNLF